jgi:hypothetical protein
MHSTRPTHHGSAQAPNKQQLLNAHYPMRAQSVSHNQVESDRDKRERVTNLRRWCAIEMRHYAGRLCAASLAWLLAREVNR